MEETSSKPLESWAEVNTTLQEMSGLLSEKKAITACYRLQIDPLEIKLKVFTDSIDDKLKELEEKIVEFVNSHSEEVQEGKKKELPYGRISLRQSTRIEFADEDLAAERLIHLGYGDCVKKTYKPIKSAVKCLDEILLTRIQATVINENKVKVEPKEFVEVKDVSKSTKKNKR